ncbi:MAG: hypothetical protein IJ258_00075 [Methanobrevibacter sp.]|uniref:hypothetical protein n=1 Tax=Methanobrevibacter sp. TaxID=66852 RepID=UPI0025D539D5|nr:hypothetical protein [Methanobrevibacter sp.]MBQ8016479.1 hypothetical protein [Methanobrevibacter sp.]
MNLKSDILKLSIIFMLILVLIPVASAMDSNDTFYEEYDYSDCEEVVDEVVDYEVDDTQDYESSTEEDYKTSDTVDEDLKDYNQDYQSYSHVTYEDDDQVIIPELNEDDVSVTHNIDVIELETIYSNVIEDINDLTDDINETSEDELTFDENSVNVQDSFISKYNIKVDFKLIDDLFYNGINYFGMSFNNYNRFMMKFLELKDNLLLNQGMLMYFANHKIDDSEEIHSINKITTDYAYNIDNSIVGADAIVNLLSCFFNFESNFDTIFSITFGDNFLIHAVFIKCCDIKT